MYKKIVLLLLILVVSGSWLKAEAAGDFKSRVSGLTRIEGIRIYSDNDKRVRVVIDTAAPVEYRSFVLSNPTRIAVDIKKSWLSPEVPREIAVSGGLVGKVRVSQNNPETVRLVVEANVSRERYRIFTLKPNDDAAKGNRVVMDFGDLAQDADLRRAATDESLPPVDEQQFPEPREIRFDGKPGLTGKTVVIDPGHGGSDSGAVGANGSYEKTITLKISQELQKLLKKAGTRAILTRTTDRDVARQEASSVEELQARVDVAEKARADIFISIHMDAFVNQNVSGTSSYIYPKTTNDVRLGKLVREGVIRQLGTEDRNTRNCNFYVVKHASMPATLVEVAFISNAREEKLLCSDAGVKRAAQGIFEGIKRYFSADED